MSPSVRQATTADLDALTALENRTFTSDKISRRSFRHFLDTSQNALLVIGDPVIAYGLILFHRGTSLARVYSLTVAPEARGQGHARRLMLALEEAACQRDALFLRLEVATHNQAAIHLYRSLGYRPIKQLPGYYEDGGDALRMEKPLGRYLPKPGQAHYYAQTTEFTCGPAALLMAMSQLDKQVRPDQMAELDLWRDATTIFMAQGHGGCSPQGLAYAAYKRGWEVRLLQSSAAVPFVQSVRDPQKKQVIESIHKRFVADLEAAQVETLTGPIHTSTLRQSLQQGYCVILLISTYQLNRNKAPHWVWLVAMDDDFAYINDPYVDTQTHQSELDNTYVPVPLENFARMISYGRNKYRAAVLLR